MRKHHELYANALPMIASENVTSNTVRTLLASDLSHRYAEGEVGARFYQGCEFIDEIEARAVKWAKELFGAEHANVKPISGVNANIAAIFALTSPGDKMMALSVPDGGHISHSEYSVPAIRNLKLERLPFDPAEMNIDADKMARKIKEQKPALILLGCSLFLFPHPVREAREAVEEAADEVGTTVVYDASHVLGLVAGKRFQDPLREGAEVVTSSTHKTFPGPQGAVILCNSKGKVGKTGEAGEAGEAGEVGEVGEAGEAGLRLKDKIDRAVFPGTVSNHHLHHVAGLAVALVEMKHFGEAYAAQTVANAKALAQALHEAGFEVLCEHKGFTESHQVAVDVRGLGGGGRGGSGGDAVAKKLERAGIIANKNMLPCDKMPEKPSGVRFGVQELTRLGMQESEMLEIAALVRGALVEGRDENKIREEVRELRKGFQEVLFCFDRDFDGKGAYNFSEALG